MAVVDWYSTNRFGRVVHWPLVDFHSAWVVELKDGEHVTHATGLPQHEWPEGLIAYYPAYGDMYIWRKAWDDGDGEWMGLTAGLRPPR